MKGLNKQICLFASEIEGLTVVHDWIAQILTCSYCFMLLVSSYYIMN